MDLEDRGLMTPAGIRAFENAYGWGYQVFHPTPEQRKHRRLIGPGGFVLLSPGPLACD